MTFKQTLKSMLPLIIGILIGAGITKNKSVMYIIISILVIRLLLSMFSKSITNVKGSVDKTMAARNELVKGLNSAIDYTEVGNAKGAKIFDKWYGDYIFFFNITLVVCLIYCLVMSLWVWSLCLFLGIHIFVILNQIVRKVKHLGNDDYIRKPRTDVATGVKYENSKSNSNTKR